MIDNINSTIKAVGEQTASGGKEALMLWGKTFIDNPVPVAIITLSVFLFLLIWIIQAIMQADTSMQTKLFNLAIYGTVFVVAIISVLVAEGSETLLQAMKFS